MKKRTLSFWNIWNMSFSFLGLQMGFAHKYANVSRIFQSLVGEINDRPNLWLRRPYFLFNVILASLALLIITNSPFIWIAASILGLLALKVIYNQPVFALLMDGDSMSIAGGLSLTVNHKL